MAAELVGMNRHSATLFDQTIREMTAYELDDDSPSEGEIENESYFGGPEQPGSRVCVCLLWRRARTPQSSDFRGMASPSPKLVTPG